MSKTLSPVSEAATLRREGWHLPLGVGSTLQGDAVRAFCAPNRTAALALHGHDGTRDDMVVLFNYETQRVGTFTPGGKKLSVMPLTEYPHQGAVQTGRRFLKLASCDVAGI